MDFSDSDSYDSDGLDSDGLGIEAPPNQVQAGYNSYGRPSMTTANNHDFQQQSSEDDDSSSDDSDEEPAAMAAPVQPRGKTFRPPVGEGDSSSSSSEDEGDLKPPASASNGDAAMAQVINPNPVPPRGKELRLILKGNDSSSDDELLVSKKTKAKPKATNGARKKAAPKKTATKAKSPTKKKASEKKKRKAPPANNDSDSSSDEECIATVVGGSDTDDVMAVAENVKSNKKVKANDGTAKKKTTAKKTTANNPAKKPGPKKGTKKSTSYSGTSAALYGMPEVSAEKAEAAQSARNKLQEAVTRLPHKFSDSHTIRSFGRINPEYNVSPLDALYSSPHAIYPMGFSCDRFEFSPVHGRVIKMRCDILDGSSLREQREQMQKDEAKLKSDESGEPMLVDEKMPGEQDIENLGDGPVFRVTWGEGVEQDKILEPSCPFDPYVASAHLGGGVDAIAVPLSSKKGKLKGNTMGLPEVGMRVSVRFDKSKMYGGAITKVKPSEKKTKNKMVVCSITIQYDDGVTEVSDFPDPDIVVAHQGE